LPDSWRRYRPKCPAPYPASLCRLIAFQHSSALCGPGGRRFFPALAPSR
jgi:hypothetical protein